MNRTIYEFRMVEQNGPDENAPLIREVSSVFVTDEGATHDTITERYFEFLKGCGYSFRLGDEIRYVREDELL